MGLLVLDELDHAPQDQERGPVVSEQGSQPHPGEHVQVAQQEDDPEDDQDKRSGERGGGAEEGALQVEIERGGV